MEQVDHRESPPGSIGDPLDAIVKLAQECRATTIAHDALACLGRRHGTRMQMVDATGPHVSDKAFAAQRNRNLCRRLQHHLFEYQRALAHPVPDMRTRINALTVVRGLAEGVLSVRGQQPDVDRQRLATWLSLERTKFLMRAKADALIALDERMAQIREPRRGLRRVATAAAGEIAVELLASLWVRMRAGAEQPMSSISNQLVADLESWLVDLGEFIPLDAMAGIELAPLHRFERHAEPSPPSSMISDLADRTGLVSRKRIEDAARAELVGQLDCGSQRVAARILDHYDRARAAMECRFCELIDGVLESVELAAEVASEAQAGGTDGLARVRGRLAQWSVTLSEIVADLE